MTSCPNLSSCLSQNGLTSTLLTFRSLLKSFSVQSVVFSTGRQRKPLGTLVALGAHLEIYGSSPRMTCATGLGASNAASVCLARRLDCNDPMTTCQADLHCLRREFRDWSLLAAGLWLTHMDYFIRSYLMTPHAHTRVASPAPTSPPGSGSSAVSWFDETPTHPPSRSDSILPDVAVRLTSFSQTLLPSD